MGGGGGGLRINSPARPQLCAAAAAAAANPRRRRKGGQQEKSSGRGRSRRAEPPPRSARGIRPPLCGRWPRYRVSCQSHAFLGARHACGHAPLAYPRKAVEADPRANSTAMIGCSQQTTLLKARRPLQAGARVVQCPNRASRLAQGSTRSSRYLPQPSSRGGKLAPTAHATMLQKAPMCRNMCYAH